MWRWHERAVQALPSEKQPQQRDQYPKPNPLHVNRTLCFNWARPVLLSNLGAEGDPVETGLRPNFNPSPSHAGRRRERNCCVVCTA